MNKKTARRVRLGIAVLFCIAVPLILGQRRAQKIPARESSIEQRTFSVEDESVKHPVPVPPKILRILAKDSAIQEILKNLDRSADALPTSWFLASEVHLNAPDERDLVVIGQGPSLGANVTMFWIFRPKHEDYELIFNTSAHNLSVKETRSSGYRDVEATAATGVRVVTVRYRFDGTIYKALTANSARIPE